VVDPWVIALMIATGAAAGCNRGSTDHAPPDAATSAGSAVAANASLAADLDCHPSGPPPAPPPGASASALRPDFRPRLTMLRVSAHVGAVSLRKRGSSWVTAGDQGCTVPARRMERALGDLERLAATKTEERPADGQAFELQIVALMGDDIALELAIASRSNTGDLVQLWDGSRVRMRGLDRSLWSPHPADWCNE
jgi:hypothetical protein